MSDLPAHAGENIESGSALVIDPETRLFYGTRDFMDPIFGGDTKATLIRQANAANGQSISVAVPLFNCADDEADLSRETEKKP